MEPSSATGKASRDHSACGLCARVAARGLSCGRAEAASTDAEGACSSDLHLFSSRLGSSCTCSFMMRYGPWILCTAAMRGSCGRRGSSPARAVRPKAEERRHTANTQHLSRDRLVTDHTRPLKGGQHANPTQESRTLPERGHTLRVAAVATAVIDTCSRVRPPCVMLRRPSPGRRPRASAPAGGAPPITVPARSASA